MLLLAWVSAEFTLEMTCLLHFNKSCSYSGRRIQPKQSIILSLSKLKSQSYLRKTLRLNSVGAAQHGRVELRLNRFRKKNFSIFFWCLSLNSHLFSYHGSYYLWAPVYAFILFHFTLSHFSGTLTFFGSRLCNSLSRQFELHLVCQTQMQKPSSFSLEISCLVAFVTKGAVNPVMSQYAALFPIFIFFADVAAQWTSLSLLPFSQPASDNTFCNSCDTNPNQQPAPAL